MGDIAAILNRTGHRPADDLVLKFLEHFAAIRAAMEHQGLWDETDGLFYDRLVTPGGAAVPVKVRSMVGIIPLLAAAVIDEQLLEQGSPSASSSRASWTGMACATAEKLAEAGLLRGEPGSGSMLLERVGIDRLEQLFGKLFDAAEFLSPYGLRALSAYHRDHPYVLEVEGVRATIDYEPAESTTAMFGGNSNWRGPIWFPLNYLVVSVAGALPPLLRRRLHDRVPDRVGQPLSLDAIAADLWDRLVSIFLRGPGRPATLLRRGRAAAARPALEGQPDVQRVLPRRQRRRPRAPRTRPAGPASWPTSSAAGTGGALDRRRHSRPRCAEQALYDSREFRPLRRPVSV